MLITTYTNLLPMDFFGLITMVITLCPAKPLDVLPLPYMAPKSMLRQMNQMIPQTYAGSLPPAQLTTGLLLGMTTTTP